MKNKFGRAVCLALCGAVAISAAACNGGGMREFYKNQSLEALYDKFDGDLERGTEAKPITLRVLENDTAKSAGYLKVLLDGFNEKYRDYNIVAVDAGQDQYTNLADDGPYGYGPDVLYQANDALMKYCDGKHITPLPIDKIEAYDELPQLAKDTYTYTLDGVDYFMGVGVNIQAPMMYYRKDLLPEDWETKWDDNNNGIPDMQEDMRAMWRFGIERHASDSTKYGFMQSLFDPYFSCGYLFTYGAYVFGAPTAPAHKAAKALDICPTPAYMVNFRDDTRELTTVADITNAEPDLCIGNEAPTREAAPAIVRTQEEASLKLAADRGNALHDILARIATPADLDAAVGAVAARYGLDDATAEEYAATLREAFHSAGKRVLQWFGPGLRILAEQTIYDADRRESFRPDRIVFHPDGSVDIVDYKFTTEPHDSHRTQVQGYKNMLRAMGHTRLRGYLWYPELRRILEV